VRIVCVDDADNKGVAKWSRRLRRRLVAWLHTDNWLDKHFPRWDPRDGISDRAAGRAGDRRTALATVVQGWMKSSFG
jgi:hypothetical protein